MRNISATPLLGRRTVTLGLVSSGASLILRSQSSSAAEAQLLTPQQMEGPFYPVNWVGDADNDLVVVKGEAARALGHVTHITGRVLKPDGNGVSGATVEIWQCDAHGIYRHPRDNSLRRKSDAGFQSRGRTLTATDGSYSFRTIRPVSYPGRTPHIHFKVFQQGRETLTTQMYVYGEPQNERDGILHSLGARERDSVIVRLDAADQIEQGALAGVFNIVIV